MNKFVRLTAIAGLLLAGASYAADTTTYRIDQLPQLHQEPEHATVSERVTSRFTRSHYRQFALDDQFSAKIFDRYLNMLDYNHNVLLASDVAKFADKKHSLDDELKSGQLDTPYALFNLAQKRRFERYQYALSVLNRPMDFTGNDTIDIDRSKAPWPTSEAELNKLWDAKVKYDQLNLKLTGKTDKEIKETLTKRYQAAIKRLTQSNSEDVFQLIMNAFAHEIDPHTNYLSPRNTEQFNTEMSLSLEGIGAVLQMDDDYTLINSMVPGGPAAKSKTIAVGDRVIGVGQTGKPMVDVIGWRLDDVVALIKGPKGSKVRLEILPAGKGTKPRTVTLTRERIRLEDRAVKMSVKTIGKERVGVLDIPGFYVGLTEDVKVQLQKLEKQNVSSIIIDLRSNGGGALTEAVSLSGLFIPSGPVVQVRDNNGKVREDSDTDGVVYYKGPLVVLVDRYSASASEIFAAAMQDYGRALIVGEPTFGKGTVQQYRSLNRIYDQMLRPEWPALGSLQYTIQKFYRVDGGSTQRKGVTPDIVMPTGVDPAETGESFEDNALPWDSINAASYTKVGDLKPLEPELLKIHAARIAADPEFQHIQQDIERYKALKDKKNIVSLNYAQREKENHDDDATRLNRLNERFKREGKKPLKSLEDLPKDYQEPDPYLDETVHIALDLAHKEKAQPQVESQPAVPAATATAAK
ncbi:carboxy terminal-processing peptidase [Yersinia enterocolitica]|uniref:carboxy terminal-processing peptidase n=1 Tax=Yersinia enterocolitica TaxID=630 RepID=UPI001C8D9436|nr:carboxy terminal-processing peptidase [Yersinia enterocolitica]MBX9496617.1 carboxy terminal-processing peptidase [Yersinia enterocolitica]